ncbi:MAG: hypothetical protein ACI9B9_000133 [Halioglobus sp.]|jgi:hypothetical protein
MYFDFLYYRKVLSYTWAQSQWPGRNKTLFKLLLLIPITTVLHTLCLALDYIFFPRLWRQQVEAPVFIVGHARSGTTLMHRLMAADGERFSYFYYWETFFPALTQRAVIRGIGWLDRTLLRSTIQRRFEAWDEKTFGSTRHIHNQGLWIPEEDQFVMKAAFVTQQWALDLPLMNEVDIFHIESLSGARKRNWMKFYKGCVKRQLLSNGGNKTHLSKNPLMCGWVNAIIETFPDARVVVMMRDPVQCIPSTLRLAEIVWKGKKWQKEQYAGAQQALTQISFDSFRLPAQVLAQRPKTPHYFVDYRVLLSSPRKAVASVYGALNIPMSDDYSDYLVGQEEKEKNHSSHYRYNIEDYAVTPEEIEHELEDFYQQYQWPRVSEQQA